MELSPSSGVLLAKSMDTTLRGVLLPSRDVLLSVDVLNSQSVIAGGWLLVAGETHYLCPRSYPRAEP